MSIQHGHATGCDVCGRLRGLLIPRQHRLAQAPRLRRLGPVRTVCSLDLTFCRQGDRVCGLIATRQAMHSAYACINFHPFPLHQQSPSTNNFPVSVASSDVNPEASAASGAPPTLALGADDIFWVVHLHAALDEQGYHPGDEEVEAWVFGEQTLSALLTFQASGLIHLQGPLWCFLIARLQLRCPLMCSFQRCPVGAVWVGAQATRGLEETGVCDADAWRSLLRPEQIATHLAEAARLVGAARVSSAGSLAYLQGLPWDGHGLATCASTCRLPPQAMPLVQ